jgi:hypothetical protein
MVLFPALAHSTEIVVKVVNNTIFVAADTKAALSRSDETWATARSMISAVESTLLTLACVESVTVEGDDRSLTYARWLVGPNLLLSLLRQRCLNNNCDVLRV